MKTLNRKHVASGFTLTETLVGVALLAVMVLGVMSFQASIVSQGQSEKTKASLSAVKARILQTVSSDAAWLKTVDSASTSSHLSCINSIAGCVSFNAAYDFDLYQADGTLVYSGSTMGGYDLNGLPCEVGSGSCPLALSLRWTPSCAASDTNCRSPLIKITGTFSSVAPTGGVNLNKYSFTINRPPLTVALCATSTAPACGAGAVSICQPTGWSTCVPTDPPYCTGTASWNDAGTSYGPCSAVVSAPGVLHNTTATLANTSSGNIGSADFLCIPGQPMNGFIQQGAGTCSPAPTNGLCGSADGNSYTSAANATAAGLCAAGTLSAALSGAGPWSWNCNGLFGGTSASCTANAAPIVCPPQTLSWTIGADTCSANFASQAASTTSALTSDSVGPTLGSASFSCDAAGAWATSPQAGATCATASTCPAQALSWTVGASTCTDNAPVTPSGGSTTLKDLVRPTTGFAVYNCVAGAWTLDIAQNKCVTSGPVTTPARSKWRKVTSPTPSMCALTISPSTNSTTAAMFGGPVCSFPTEYAMSGTSYCGALPLRWCILCAPGSDATHCLRDLDTEAKGSP